MTFEATVVGVGGDSSAIIGVVALETPKQTIRLLSYDLFL